MEAGDKARIVKIQGYTDAQEKYFPESTKKLMTQGLTGDLEFWNWGIGSVVMITQTYPDGFVAIEGKVRLPKDCLEKVE